MLLLSFITVSGLPLHFTAKPGESALILREITLLQTTCDVSPMIVYNHHLVLVLVAGHLPSLLVSNWIIMMMRNQ